MKLTLLSVLAMLCLPTLTACADLTQMLPSRDKTTSVRPNICNEVKTVYFHLGKIDPATGKSDVGVADILIALRQSDPIESVRHVVGDTDDTILQTKKNNAAINSLCKE